MFASFTHMILSVDSDFFVFLQKSQLFLRCPQQSRRAFESGESIGSPGADVRLKDLVLRFESLKGPGNHHDGAILKIGDSKNSDMCMIYI